MEKILEQTKAYQRVYTNKARIAYNNKDKPFVPPVSRMKGNNSMFHHLSVLRTPATRIDHKIIIGSAFDAANYYTLNSNGVKTVINCSKGLDNYFPDKFLYRRVPIDDNSIANFIPYIENIIKWLEEDDDPIFIHCYMGASRSAIVVLLYLTYFKKMSYEDALEFLVQKRPVVNINVAFIAQLKNFLRLHLDRK